MFPTALLALAVQAASHEGLHPAGAQVFFEAPEFGAVLSAYPSAPMAQLCADGEALGALRTLLGQPELTGSGLVDSSFPLMGMEGVTVALLAELRAVSFSAAGERRSQDLYALTLLDASDDAAATAFADLLQGEGRWVEREGARVAVGVGAMTPERWHGLRDRTAEAEPTLTASAVPFDPPGGPVFLRGFQRVNLMSAIDAVMDFDHDPLPAAWEFLIGSRTTHFRMALVSGRFVTESWSPGARSPLASAEWLARAPVGASLLAEVHPGCLLVAGASFERAGLRDALAGALETDLSSAALFDKLGASAVLFVQPVRGLGLPKSFLVVELRRAEAVLDDVMALFPAGGAVEAEQRKYKDVPYVTLTLPADIATLGDLGTVRPVIAVFDGRLFVTNGTLAMKAEIRRRLGDEREQLGPADYPWTRGASALGPDVTAFVYVDWAAQVDSLLSLARSFGGALSGMAPELPFDLTNLPDSQLFTRHMPTTMHTARAVAGGVLQRHEAGFAFETWSGLVSLVGIVMEAMGEPFGPQTASAPAVAEPASPDETPDGATRDGLRALRTALTVYEIDQGALPAELQRLVEPTANYPSGYLDGKTALEPDAWGRPFRYALADGGATYRLWSLGADGVDQDGAGDDVVPR
jgi:hypothetical protein